MSTERGRRLSWRGSARALRRGLLGLVVAVSAYLMLVQLDVLRSPLDPTLAGEIELARSDARGLRVLFVGNSYTYENSMPSLVRELAAADRGGPTLFTVQYTAPAWRLKSASRDDGLRALLREVPWDAVVLQEASRIPALPPLERQQEMDAYARGLAHEIRALGAQPLLFMTWGHRDGDERAGSGDTYTGMQTRVADGYRAASAALDVPVVEVGLAWQEALQERPGIALWSGDGKHPSRLGSYLAASVFYAALSGHSPGESTFTAGLPSEEAAFVRAVAGRFGHPEQPDR